MRKCTACEREHPSDPEISRNKNANEVAWDIFENRRRKEFEKSAKNMEYAAEKKKFDQMEKCRAQIENYQSRRHVAERSMGRKKGELE